jgi:hypothetical protein
MATFNPFGRVTPVAGMLHLSGEEVGGLAYLLYAGASAKTIEELGLDNLTNLLSAFAPQDREFYFSSLATLSPKD